MATRLIDTLLDAVSRLLGTPKGRRPSPRRTPARRLDPGATRPPAIAGRARTYRGPVRIAYAPERDGDPDPGEVVWTWVPYEEDDSQGKDRPVVVMGFAEGGDLAGLMLSSRDHRGDPGWFYLGAGAWDRQGRPSSVRLDRVLAVAPEAVRREGAALDRRRFEEVAARLTARRR